MTWLLLFFWFHACLPDRNRAGLMKKPKRELDIGELKWGRRRKREHDPDHSWFLPLASVSNGPLWTHGHDADTSAPHYKEDLKLSQSSADYVFFFCSHLNDKKAWIPRMQWFNQEYGGFAFWSPEQPQHFQLIRATVREEELMLSESPADDPR